MIHLAARRAHHQRPGQRCAASITSSAGPRSESETEFCSTVILGAKVLAPGPHSGPSRGDPCRSPIRPMRHPRPRSAMSGSLKGFGRRPFAGARAGRGAGVRKPRKGETAGRKRRGLGGRDLWGFEGRGRIGHVAAGTEGGRCGRRERTRRAFLGTRMPAAGVGAAAGESLRRW